MVISKPSSVRSVYKDFPIPELFTKISNFSSVSFSFFASCRTDLNEVKSTWYKTIFGLLVSSIILFFKAEFIVLPAIITRHPLDARERTISWPKPKNKSILLIKAIKVQYILNNHQILHF